MAKYPNTIPYSGTLGTTDTTDKYPTHMSILGLGGHHQYTTIEDRDNIPIERRQAGMWVTITSPEHKTYELEDDLITWTERTFGGTTGEINVENISVYDPLKQNDIISGFAYEAGNTYVSYVNVQSENIQFQSSAIYRCLISAYTGESPENTPAKWEYNGQTIVIANASTAITTVQLQIHLKQLTGYKTNHTVAVLEDNIIYKYDSTTNSGIKPNDNPTLGSWIFIANIEKVYNSDFTVQLLNGKTFGKYINGQTVPATGKTAMQLLQDIAIEYLIPAFNTFSSTQLTTVEVGTTISTPMSFTFTFINSPNIIANSLKIIDVTNLNTVLIQNQPLISPISTPIGLMIKTINGAVNSWKGQATNTNLQLLDSPQFSITWRLKTFYGAVSTAFPIDSAGVRGLASSLWDTSNSFSITLNQLKYSIALRTGKNLASVVTQNNENITSNFANGGTVNVLLADGVTTQSYTIYNFESATIMNVNATVTLS